MKRILFGKVSAWSTPLLYCMLSLIIIPLSSVGKHTTYSIQKFEASLTDCGQCYQSNNDQAFLPGSAITGTVVRFSEEPLPINGATITAFNDLYTYSATSANGGIYFMGSVEEGIYTITAEATGYIMQTIEHIFVGSQQVVTVDFQLMEFPDTVLILTATLNEQQNEVFVNWCKHCCFHDIYYDDDVPENATAWLESGNMNALRFTPYTGYPVEIISLAVNIGDGTYPPGGNCLLPFQIAIYDDDGPDGLPGTELAITNVYPEDCGWVIADFSNSHVIIDSGDFYGVMIQRGDWPNCAPIAVDETNPVFRSYSRYISGGGSWQSSGYADFMIRAAVYCENDFNTGNRDFEAYKIYLLHAGDEQNPENWILLDSTITSTEYIDTNWSVYSQRWYKYAVISKYTYNQSEPVFSNQLPHFIFYELFISLNDWDQQPIVGAMAILCNQSSWNECDTLYSDESGSVAFQDLESGYYTLTVLAEGMTPYLLNNIIIPQNNILNITLTPDCPPPLMFQVNSMGEAKWYPPDTNCVDLELEGYNVYLNGVYLTFTEENQYIFENLVPGMFYIAGVDAKYNACQSIIVEEPFVFYPCDSLGHPYNFSGSVDGNTILLTWDPPPGYETSRQIQAPDNNMTFTLLGFNIYRNENMINDELVTTNEYLDMVSPGGIYIYNIKDIYSLNANKNCYVESCSLDPPLEVTAGDEFLAPSGLTATVENINNVILTWRPPETTSMAFLQLPEDEQYKQPDLIGYNIWRDPWNNIAFVTDTAISDENVTPGTHDYYVSALYNEGESFVCGPACVTVPATGIIQGYVRDGITWEIISCAQVKLDPIGLIDSTNPSGQFIFKNILVDSYEVTASAEGYVSTILSGIDVNYNTVTLLNIPLYSGNQVIYSLPFTETWYSGSPETHDWTFSPQNNNWMISQQTGNPPPSAIFNFTPFQSSYTHSLISPVINATGATDKIFLSFDVSMEDFEIGKNEKLQVKIWYDTSWILVDEFNSEMSLDWGNHLYNISHTTRGKLFKLQFTALGENSYLIDHWSVDNIKVFQSFQELLEGKVTELATGCPLDSAAITIPGYPTVYTNGEGYYSTCVNRGTYSVLCEATGYNPLQEVILIDEITSWDVQLTQPLMNINPLALLQVYNPYYDTTIFYQYLTIFNEGNGELGWSAEIVYLNESEHPFQRNSMFNNNWLSLDTCNGIIQPGNQQELTVTFNAEELQEYNVYMADIIFSPSPDVGSVTVTVLFYFIDNIPETDNKSLIRIYPNPSRKNINIESSLEMKEIRIKNYPGQVVYEMFIRGSKKISIPLYKLSVGTYVIEITLDDGNIIPSKIVVVK